MKDVFERLKSVVSRAQKFVLNSGNDYRGPVNPVGLCRQIDNHRNRSRDFLVLAEHVPLEFTLIPDGSEPFPTGVVLIPLDDDLNFVSWDPQTATVMKLSSLQWCSDGTIEAACLENTGRNFTWEVLYKEH
ncbi:MAG TPA: hypothetical protein VNJ70_02400 [Thermoanaerobaculia bacterium]|nr:hypothetical protein [Thermoanaerobaculia bacterium]